MLKYGLSQGLTGKVWLDFHWSSDHDDAPVPSPEITWSMMKHLDHIAPGHNGKLCVFELNADRHTWECGMCNAYSILEGINHSEILPFMCSANCLQVDKHNDDGWDQGLVFLNNRNVWYQAPACVNLLISKMMLDKCFDTDETQIDLKFNYAAAETEISALQFPEIQS
ncbi:MAG: hypothetical protein IKC46_03470 [Lachnospiraceae bacterium]|nr:hypothetical protein [Lachnospiraceae bacterium]